MSQFVIRHPGTPGVAPHLAAALPLRATTLVVLSDSAGKQDFWCARLSEPIKYRFDDHFDRARCQPEFLAGDDEGEFLWVMVVAVWPDQPHERLHANMQGLGVRVAYVVDQTLGRDTIFDPRKVDVIGTAVADDASAPVAAAATSPAPPRRDPQSAATRAELDADGDEEDDVWDVKRFRYELRRMMANLTTLASTHPGADLPVEAGHDPGPRPDRPTYQLGPDQLRYYRFDQQVGWQWVIPRDFEDLLYRLVEDTARLLAWRWSEKAPASADGEATRQGIARDFQHFLMRALNSAWDTRIAD
jgi:hypothetical protein